MWLVNHALLFRVDPSVPHALHPVRLQSTCVALQCVLWSASSGSILPTRVLSDVWERFVVFRVVCVIYILKYLYNFI